MNAGREAGVVPDLKELVYQAFAAAPGTKFVKQDGEELDRSKVLNASEAGLCLRQIVFSKADPARSQADFATLDRAGYAERGKAVEEWFNQRFHDHNMTAHGEGVFTYFGKLQRSFVYKNLSATPDGVFTIGRKSWNLDVKSIDPRTSRSKLPKNNHVVQVKQAAHILGKTTPYNIVGSIILYVDASNFGDMVQKFIPIDPTFESWIEARADIALSGEQPSKVKAEGLLTEDGCKYCSFTHACSDAMEVSANYLVNLADAERALKNARQSESSD